MILSRDFFDLNLQFARRVSEVTGQSFQSTLLGYTHLYLAFGIGRDFNAQNPVWQSYLNAMMNGADPAEYTYRVYLEQLAKQPKERPENPFGCFFYALWDGNRVRLHFHNAPGKRGVLRKQKMPERIAELTSMFEHLKQIMPAASTVVGGSWLYNIEAYRRLFPPSYLETAKVSDQEYQFIALWGQFVSYDGSVRQRMAKKFLEGIKNEKTLEGLKSRFPYQVFRVESPIEDFYAFYGVE
jgi:hypothetical protein